MKKKSTNKKEAVTFLCLDSFLETLKKCDFSFAKYLNIRALSDNHILDKIQVSYISHETFLENKRGVSEKKLFNELPLIFSNESKEINKLLNFPLSTSFFNTDRYAKKITYDFQIRGFKTDRNVEAELSRNPSLLRRLRVIFGMQHSTQIDSKSPKDLVSSNERLKHILTNEAQNMTDVEKERLKIAFAEGYLLGNNPKSGKAAKYFRVVQQVLTVAIFFAIIISLMASASGSSFRYACLITEY